VLRPVLEGDLMERLSRQRRVRRDRLASLYSESADPQPRHIIDVILQPLYGLYTVKKAYRFSHPHPGLTKLSWPGIIKLFPARESLVSDIPVGDRKIANLFLQCNYSEIADAKIEHLQ
jgi:hypothetical protein